MPIFQRVYRFRMRPTRAQEQALLRQAGARRWVWNWGLARRQAYFAEHSKSIPAAQLSVELTALKTCSETAWLREADSQALQQTLADLDRAFKNFFEKRARFPRFKSKHRDAPAFRIPQRVKVADGRVYVPKIGWVRIRQSQAIDGTTKSATFKRDACGRWFVALVAAFTMPDVTLALPALAKSVGLDAGLKDFAVLSNGERTAAPRFYRKAARKLRRAQRVFCRRQPGSKRRAKAKQCVARVHQHLSDQRRDFLHKLSTNIIRRFDAVFIEDLNLKGLARTKLAKSFNDAAHGEFRRQLEYKSLWNRKHLVAVGRFFPSSKTCHECGAVNDALTLSDRQWVCVCGTVHDRDHNASLNIREEGLRLLAAGHADKQNAQGAGVSPAQGGQSASN